MGTQHELPIGTLYVDDLRRLEAILTADHARPAQGHWTVVLNGHRWEAASLDTLLAKIPDRDPPIEELTHELWLIAVHRDNSMESVGTVVVVLAAAGNSLSWQNDAELEAWDNGVMSDLEDIRKLLVARPHDGKAVAYLRERRVSGLERVKAELLEPTAWVRDVRSLVFGILGGVVTLMLGHYVL
ncbi:MAG: hypothetical protein JWM90_188 [Thermoleophilia bacterium]|nr:hypothetical protein [Thermoleophilia bacterium]